MTRIQRRLLIDTSVIGITLTLFVMVLDYYGRVLQPLEDWFYDYRAKLCQFYTPPPTDKLIHIDIDDTALQVLGKWPWPRAQFAELINEIDRAGAKAIFMDIVFDEPSNPTPRPVKVGPDKYIEVDDDAILAEAFKRSGKCLIPVALNAEESPSKAYHALVELLRADVELSQGECQQRLVTKRLLPPGRHLDDNLFIKARMDAMNLRVNEELSKGKTTIAALRSRIIPNTDPSITNTPLVRLLEDQFVKVEAMRPLRKYMTPIPAGLPPLAKYGGELAPLPSFSVTGVSCGFVNYLQTGEGGVVRAVPLFVNYRDQLFPQTDLALACVMLGADIHAVKIFPDRVVIPKPPGEDHDIEIPVRTIRLPQFDRDIGLFMDIPVRGTRDWTTIYDHPDHQKPELHLSAASVWDPFIMMERVARNNANIDRALSIILDDDHPDSTDPNEVPRIGFDSAKWKQYVAKRPAADDTAARRAFANGVLEDLKGFGMVSMGDDSDTSISAAIESLLQELSDFAQEPTVAVERHRGIRSLLDIAGAPTDPRERAKHEEFANALRGMSNAFAQNQRFDQLLTSQRDLLRRNINGRAVMIGWAATARTDFVPTAIQPICAGVVLHGMAYNAIMTRDFWYHVPKWVTALITLALGLTITAANGLFKPGGALIMAILLGTAYLFLNGLVLFDRYRILAGVAGPMVALGSVWATGTLASFLIESRERARITKRFSSYNDPKLVNFFIENPEANMDGQVREMSVVFTDLAGFTTLSERLGERTVPILSRYFSIMVPIIRRNNGYVNKFLGDGIMCFFNAPDDDSDHAAHAVQTVLEMQRGMRQFADDLVAEGLPRVSMRCGVSTGTMVVGDSGPSDGCDYTVLGDTVNFASRLEGANKAVGTNILISHRTTELLGESRFLLRPVGKLQVVGKSESVMTYEPLAPFDDATPQDMVAATMSTEMIAAYFAKDFQKCIEFADKMDAQIGATKLPGLYRKSAMKYIENPPGAEFAGNLILTEK